MARNAKWILTICGSLMVVASASPGTDGQPENPGPFAWLTNMFNPKPKPSQPDHVTPLIAKTEGTSLSKTAVTATSETEASTQPENKVMATKSAIENSTHKTEIAVSPETNTDVVPNSETKIVPKSEIDVSSRPKTETPIKSEIETETIILPSSRPDNEIVAKSEIEEVPIQPIMDEATTVDTYLWSDLQKQYAKHFGVTMSGKVPTTHWRVAKVLSHYKSAKLTEMCQAAYSKKQPSDPEVSEADMKENELMNWRRMILGPTEPSTWKLVKPIIMMIDIVRCAEKKPGEFHITKGRRDNSVYFVKPIEPFPKQVYYILDERFKSDIDLRKNFLEMAKATLKEQKLEW